MAITRRLLACIVCWLMCVPALMAGQAPATPRDDWSNLARLAPGREVTVHLHVPRSKVKGAFVSYSEDGVVVRLKNGNSQTIGRETVRKLTASHGRARTPVLIGAVAGATVMATLSLRESDFVPLGHILFAGGGAGIGALFGYLAHVLRGSDVVYVSPRP